jgi:hypothetical protein
MKVMMMLRSQHRIVAMMLPESAPSRAIPAANKFSREQETDTRPHGSAGFRSASFFISNRPSLNQLHVGLLSAQIRWGMETLRQHRQVPYVTTPTHTQIHSYFLMISVISGIGKFMVSYETAGDDHGKIMAQVLGDRLAEVYVAKFHLDGRVKEWGILE